MGHHQLTQTHREILASLIAGNLSIRRIAGILGYAPSSISRELKRNSGKDGKYQADMAQRKAVWRNTKDKKASRRTPELVAYVQEKLRERWSPEQIAGRLRLQAACLNLPLISFKTIYRWIQKDSDSSKVRPFKGYGKYLRLKRPGKVPPPPHPSRKAASRTGPLFLSVTSPGRAARAGARAASRAACAGRPCRSSGRPPGSARPRAGTGPGHAGARERKALP